MRSCNRNSLSAKLGIYDMKKNDFGDFCGVFKEKHIEIGLFDVICHQFILKLPIFFSDQFGIPKKRKKRMFSFVFGQKKL